MGENIRNWIGGRDAHIRLDAGVAPWLQVVVPIWVCQFNLRRLDSHRCSA